MKNNLSASEALRKLEEGNQRFNKGLRSIEAIMSPMKLQELAQNGQTPYCILLTCSDSRVPAEYVFDCGLGDLFVIRVAGNLVTPSVVASVEFAALSFGTALCVVMGHTSCGAVNAAVDAELGVASPATEHLAELVNSIRPSVRALDRRMGLGSKEFKDAAVLENVRSNVRLIVHESALIRDLVASERLTVVGAHYDIHTGRAHFHERDQNLGGVA